MHRPWLGPRRVAFVPVIRPVDAAVPDDLVAQVERRVFYDPDPATGADRSLRTYIRTVSGHRADLEGVAVQGPGILDAERIPLKIKLLDESDLAVFRDGPLDDFGC